MDKCLVCEKEKNSSGKPCKMCGMSVDGSVSWNGFDFCSEKCLGHFRSMMDKLPPEESINLAKEDVII